MKGAIPARRDLPPSRLATPVYADRRMAIGCDDVAEIYHDAWPPYPAALFERIVTGGGLRPGARILEIGCGTGLATLPLAERGFSIVALEPGPRLAREARERLAGSLLVQVEQTTFEKWAVAGADFDAVLSAQAFHWVDPAVGVPKVSQALKHGGAICLFWRRCVHRSPSLRDAIDGAYRALGIGLPGRGRMFETAEQIKADVEASGSFDGITISAFSEPLSFDGERYRRLMGVLPGNVSLAEDTRRTLLDELVRIVADHGGSVPLTFETKLYVARKK